MVNEPAITAELRTLYKNLTATQPGAVRKGAAMPYTSVNGNMFSFLDESGTLAIRLGAADRDRFIATFRTGLHEAHGRALEEYVAVPPALLDDTASMTPWFRASWTHASSLKPKGTTRRTAS